MEYLTQGDSRALRPFRKFSQIERQKFFHAHIAPDKCDVMWCVC